MKPIYQTDGTGRVWAKQEPVDLTGCDDAKQRVRMVNALVAPPPIRWVPDSGLRRLKIAGGASLLVAPVVIAGLVLAVCLP